MSDEFEKVYAVNKYDVIYCSNIEWFDTTPKLNCNYGVWGEKLVENNNGKFKIIEVIYEDRSDLSFFKRIFTRKKVIAVRMLAM